MRRLWWIVPVVVLALAAADASAQGRGRGKAKQGNGPAFCRSGAGHPVFGWQWCEERGWGTSPSRSASGRPGARDRDQVQGRDPYPDRDRNRRVSDLAFDNGYADGYEKGLDDGRDGRQADPTRHGWYRDADRNYDPDYGSRAQYANAYRDGFRSGYQAGFADGERYRDNNGGRRWPWPF